MSLENPNRSYYVCHWWT